MNLVDLKKYINLAIMEPLDHKVRPSDSFRPAAVSRSNSVSLIRYFFVRISIKIFLHLLEPFQRQRTSLCSCGTV
jgi:hypothetical protein